MPYVWWQMFGHFRLTLGSRQEELDGWGMWHVLGRCELYTGFWSGNVRERRTRCRWEDIIKNGSAGNWFVERGLDLVAPDRDTWRTFVNATMKPQVS
jgi:hypothetical protein